MTVGFQNAVGETINLFCLNPAAFQPAHNMTAGGRADVNGKCVFHNHHRYYLSTERIDWEEPGLLKKVSLFALQTGAGSGIMKGG